MTTDRGTPRRYEQCSESSTAECGHCKDAAPPSPSPSPRWRAGRKVQRTLYVQLGDEPSDDDPLIGTMDTPALAALAVAAVNERLNRLYAPSPSPASDGVSVGSGDSPPEPHRPRDLFDGTLVTSGVPTSEGTTGEFIPAPSPGSPSRNTAQLDGERDVRPEAGSPNNPAETLGTPERERERPNWIQIATHDDPPTGPLADALAAYTDVRRELDYVERELAEARQEAERAWDALAATALSAAKHQRDAARLGSVISTLRGITGAGTDGELVEAVRARWAS